MTEQEWLKCTDPTPMLNHLWRLLCESEATISERKARLFACACCRRSYHLSKDQRSKDALIAAEAFADGFIQYEQFTAAATSARDAEEDALVAYECLSQEEDRPNAYSKIIGTRLASWVMLDTDPEDGVPILSSAISVAGFAVDSYENPKVADKEQVAIIRDIIGNPFRLVTIDRKWLTPNIVAVAQGIYDERAFERLPMLADALEEAGCTNADILNHCRSEGPHVRGCWVVDLVLDK
jgi:hypothetical protein